MPPFDLAPPVLIGIAIDIVVEGSESFIGNFGFEDRRQQLIILAFITFVIWGFESIFDYVAAVTWRNIAQDLQHSMRTETFNKTLDLDLSFFENLSFDSITVNPYMGQDSVEPFLNFNNKHTILLTLTSNHGSEDFQFFGLPNKPLFEKVIEVSKSWNNSDRLMYVVGAHQIDYLKKIRSLLPDSLFLIPGVGAQGGDLTKVVLNGINDKCGLIINSSRQIIYASTGLEFQKFAEEEARKIQKFLDSEKEQEEEEEKDD